MAAFRFLDEYNHHIFTPIANALIFDESLREALSKIHIMSRPDSPDRALLTSPQECSQTVSESITKEFLNAVCEKDGGKESIRKSVAEALGQVGYPAEDVERVIGALPSNCVSLADFESTLSGNCLARKFAFPDLESINILMNDNGLSHLKKSITFPITGEYLLSLIKCAGDIFSERPLSSFNQHVARFIAASNKPISPSILNKLSKADINGLRNIIIRTRANSKNMLNARHSQGQSLDEYIKNSDKHFPQREVKISSLQKILKFANAPRTPSS